MCNQPLLSTFFVKPLGSLSGGADFLFTVVWTTPGNSQSPCPQPAFPSQISSARPQGERELLDAQTAPACTAKSSMRLCVCTRSCYKICTARCTQGGLRLGMPNKTFERHWFFFIFTTISWKWFPCWCVQYSPGCGCIRTLSQTAAQRKEHTGTGKVRTAKPHTFGDALSKNKLITLTAFFPEK